MHKVHFFHLRLNQKLGVRLIHEYIVLAASDFTRSTYMCMYSVYMHVHMYVYTRCMESEMTQSIEGLGYRYC